MRLRNRFGQFCPIFVAAVGSLQNAREGAFRASETRPVSEYEPKSYPA